MIIDVYNIIIETEGRNTKYKSIEIDKTILKLPSSPWYVFIGLIGTTMSNGVVNTTIL